MKKKYFYLAEEDKIIIFKAIIIRIIKKKNVKAGFLIGETHFSNYMENLLIKLKKTRFSLGQIYSKIEGDKPLNIINKMANTSIMVSKILLKIKPTVLVLLGDRYEP